MKKQLMASVVVASCAALGLTACNSGSDKSSSRHPPRQTTSSTVNGLGLWTPQDEQMIRDQAAQNGLDPGCALRLTEGAYVAPLNFANSVKAGDQLFQRWRAALGAECRR